MNTLLKLVSVATILAAAQGCAVNTSAPADNAVAIEEELAAGKVPSDKTIQATLASLTKGAMFISEADSPYTILEGEAGPAVSKLTVAVVRQRLAKAIKAKSSEHRDISKKTCRGEVESTLAKARAGAVGTLSETDVDDMYYVDAKAMIATYDYMKANLLQPTLFVFGTDENGDQDSEGMAIRLTVGISKTTGKLIAVMSEAVWT